jgi:hypothetical protein
MTKLVSVAQRWILRIRRLDQAAEGRAALEQKAETIARSSATVRPGY